MARRRHEQEDADDGSVFTPPEFDRKEYALTELNKAKASIFSVVMGAAVGILTAYIFLYLGASYAWPVSAMIGIMGFAAVKFTYSLATVDVSLLKKKDYIGHAFMYFLAWLAIFIIFINPPFADYSAPAVEDVHLEGMDENGNWTAYEAGSNYTEYRIVAFVYDNTEVALVEISINGGNWTRMAMTQDGLAYAIGVEYSGHGSLTYSIKATDIYGHEAIENGTLP